ncbi:MAG: hypothetical protein ACYDHP_13105 [Ferrimicrobium sp.]
MRLSGIFRSRLRWWTLAGVFGATWAWWISAQATFTSAVGIGVGGAIALCVIRVLRASSVSSEEESFTARIWPWLLLFGLAVAWELFELRGSPRIAHPTLSYLANLWILSSRLTRAGVAATWLMVGWWIVP